MKSFVLVIPAKVSAKMDKLRVADAMTEVFSLFKRLNKYIDETMPWALAKEEEKQDRLSTVLYNMVAGNHYPEQLFWKLLCRILAQTVSLHS